MLKRLVSTAAFSIALAMTIGPAQAAVVDFDELPPGDTTTNPGAYPDPTTVVSDGFQFATQGGFIVSESAKDGDTGNGLAFCPTCSVTMTHSDNELFSLESFYIFLLASGLDGIQVTGYAADGGVLNRYIDQFTDQTTIELGGAWTGLERVEFVHVDNDNGSHLGNVIDTLTVQVVPLPAGIWLMLSGLAALGFRARKG